MRSFWLEWNWREVSEAPRGWEHPERTVVLTQDWLTDPRKDDGVGKQARDAWRAVSGLGPVYESVEGPVLVCAETVETLGWLVGVHATLAARVVPALRVERQADLSAGALHALCSVKATHRALVVTPRERILLSDVVLHGRFIECPDETQDEETDPCMGCAGWQGSGDYCGAIRGPHPDLVVIRGPIGPDAWPMHPAWVRSIRDQCAEAGVPFAFTGWGEWCPTAAPRMGVADRDRAVVTMGGHIEAATWADVMGAHGDAWGAERIGQDRSGRLLDGVEHLALPEGL